MWTVCQSRDIITLGRRRRRSPQGRRWSVGRSVGRSVHRKQFAGMASILATSALLSPSIYLDRAWTDGRPENNNKPIWGAHQAGRKLGQQKIQGGVFRAHLTSSLLLATPDEKAASVSVKAIGVHFVS